MKYKIVLALILFLFVVKSSCAATVDTVSTYSASMKKEIKAVVITPDKYSKKTKYPVVYLLHGYSGNYSDWVKNVPAVKGYADLYNFIIVCPDGNFNSWYINSPVKKDSKYDTYVSGELVSYIDKNYSTVASRYGRAITGLSMGGHGALYLAINHQDVYANAGSMSGGVDLTPFTENWELKNYIGNYEAYPDRWEEYSVINNIDKLQPDSLRIYFECGVDDFFYGANVSLHNKLIDKKIPHVFVSSPGSHTWDFWANAVQYQMLFFHNQFQK